MKSNVIISMVIGLLGSVEAFSDSEISMVSCQARAGFNITAYLIKNSRPSKFKFYINNMYKKEFIAIGDVYVSSDYPKNSMVSMVTLNTGVTFDGRTGFGVAEGTWGSLGWGHYDVTGCRVYLINGRRLN